MHPCIRRARGKTFFEQIPQGSVTKERNASFPVRPPGGSRAEDVAGPHPPGPSCFADESRTPFIFLPGSGFSLQARIMPGRLSHASLCRDTIFIFRTPRTPVPFSRNRPIRPHNPGHTLRRAFRARTGFPSIPFRPAQGRDHAGHSPGPSSKFLRFFLQ